MGAEDDPNDTEEVSNSLADSDVPSPVDLESQVSFASHESKEDPGSSAEVCARIVTDMQLVEPAMLRATPAAVVLNRLGHALRTEKNSADAFANSKPCKAIDQFWSHSWNGHTLYKVLLLLVLHNGLAAVVMGTLGSVLVLPLVLSGWLPAWQAGKSAGGWCVLSGTLVTALTFFLWQPQKRVFIDRICINQNDPELKFAGVLSIGGILKNSRSMLVCWDETYFQRLWCVFELAAFLKSHDESATELDIRPTFLGPCAACLFLMTSAAMLVIRPQQEAKAYLDTPINAAIWVCGVFFVVAPVGAACLRDFFCKLEGMKDQLPKFCLRDPTCHCCETGHVLDSGQVMSCDREVMEDCIRSWFGSTIRFESHVRTRVLPEVEKRLGKYLFPYHMLAGCCIPLVWAHLDGLAIAMVDEDWRHLAERSIYVLSRWLCELPIFFALAFPLMWNLRDRRPTLCADVAVNVLCMVLPLPVYYGMYVVGEYLRQTWGVFGMLIKLVLVFVATASLWPCCSYCPCRPRTRQSGEASTRTTGCDSEQPSARA
ncbi:unnamed protein product [Symbiodinium sp. CCMP2592]|nr:unnamed protein product [Symbiodinium sp. CCMP2592]